MARPGYSYTGELLNMVREGHGEASFGNGYTYTGQFSRGKRHGTGAFLVVDGSTIEGDCFDKGQLTGLCTRTWPDGSVYYGELLEGHYHGEGFLLQLQQRKCISATWNYGQAHGKGVFVTSTSSGYLVYKGDFENHKQSGHGTLFNVFRKFRDDIEAVLKFITDNCALEESYEGYLVDGLRHGAGIVKYHDRTQYEGTWDNDFMHGDGFLFLHLDSKDLSIDDCESTQVLPIDFSEDISTYIDHSNSGKILNVKPLEDIRQELMAKSKSAGPKDFQSYLLSATNGDEEEEEELKSPPPLEYAPESIHVISHLSLAKRFLHICWPDSVSYFGVWNKNSINHIVHRAILSSSEWNRPVCPNVYPIDYQSLFIDPSIPQDAKGNSKASSASKKSLGRVGSKASGLRGMKSKDVELDVFQTQKLYRSKAITLYPGCKLPLVHVFCLTNVNQELETRAKIEEARELDEFLRKQEEDREMLRLAELQTRKKSMRVLPTSKITSRRELSSAVSKLNLRGGLDSGTDVKNVFELQHAPKILPQLFVWEAWFKGESGRVFQLSILRKEGEEETAFSKKNILEREDQEKKRSEEAELNNQRGSAGIKGGTRSTSSALRSSSANLKEKAKSQSSLDLTSVTELDGPVSDANDADDTETETVITRDDIPLLDGEVYASYLLQHSALIEDFDERNRMHELEQARLLASREILTPSTPSFHPQSTPEDLSMDRKLVRGGLSSRMGQMGSSRDLRASSGSTRSNAKLKGKSNKEQAREEAEIAAKKYMEQVLQSLPREPFPQKTDPPIVPPDVPEALFASNNMFHSGDVRNGNYKSLLQLQSPSSMELTQDGRPSSSLTAIAPVQDVALGAVIPAPAPTSKFLFNYQPSTTEAHSTLRSDNLAPIGLGQMRPHIFMPVRQDSMSSLCPEDLDVIAEISDEHLASDFDLVADVDEFTAQMERKKAAKIATKAVRSPVVQVKEFRQSVLEKINSPSVLSTNKKVPDSPLMDSFSLVSSKDESSTKKINEFQRKGFTLEEVEPESEPQYPETRDVFGTFLSSTVGGQAVFENIVVPPNVPFGQYTLRVQNVTPEEYFPTHYSKHNLPDIEFELDILPREAFFYVPQDSDMADTIS